MMNQKVHHIALQVGGSHYPIVGGDLLERSILMAVQKCIEIALANDDPFTAQNIAQHFGVEE